MSETAIVESQPEKTSWFSSSWMSWNKYSENMLRTIEKKILQCCKTSYRGWFVDVGPVVGPSDRIWTISMNTESQRTPLVLLHGLGAGVAHWCMNLDEFAQTRPIYAMDILGFGRSSRPKFSQDGEEAEGQLVRSIEEWRKEMNLEKFILLGHSMGGFLAASYAINYPERVKHLILADPWGFPERPENDDPKKEIPLWVKALAYTLQPLNPLWAVRAAGPFGQWLINTARPDISKKFAFFVEDNYLISQYIYHCNAQAPSFMAPFDVFGLFDDASEENARENKKNLERLFNNLHIIEGVSSLKFLCEHVATKRLDTCGVTCTRPGYYTIPPLKELANYKTREGYCLVNGFTVGRMGYGSVYFPGVADIANLNIDKIVYIKFKRITVYKDNLGKPKFGCGLNRRAVVTLENVFPKKDTNLYETNPEVLINGSFSELLQYANEKAGAKFIEYHPSSGSWVFQVDHFSTYGLTDSDEETLKDELRVKKQEEAGENESGEKVTRKTSSPKTEEISDESLASSNVFAPRDVNSVSNMYENMVCSFYENDMILDAGNLPEQGFGDRIFGETSRRKVTAIPRPSFRVPTQVYTLLNPTCKVPAGCSVLAERVLMDAAMFKGKSFKVGWSGGLTITGLSPGCNRRVEITEISKTTKVLCLGVDVDPFMDTVGDYMRVILASSELIVHETKPPLIQVKNPVEMLKGLVKTSKDSTHSWKYNKKMIYQDFVWRLVELLWGTCDEDSYVQRRALFEEWLEDITYEKVVSDLNHCEERFKKMFIYLTGHQIEAASKIAMSENLPQLSQLLVQLPANDYLRDLIENQLTTWNESEAYERIQEDVLKMYMLLAGRSVYHEVNICNHLDWLRCLALQFWYVTEYYKPISHGIQIYEEAFEMRVASAPTPIFGYGDETHDLLYQLMKLYSNPTSKLSTVLTPETHVDDPTDYRLSWLLQIILTSMNVGLTSVEEQTYLAASVSAQLESQGWFKWSILPLLTIREETLRKNLILNVLNRNVTMVHSSIEDEIVNDLGVPAGWIHQVKAIKSTSLGLHWSAYAHFAYAQQWNKVHALIQTHLTPLLVSNQEFTLLNCLLGNCFPFKDSIPEWNNRGGLIMDFFEISTSINDSLKDLSDEKLKALYREVKKFIARLKSYDSVSAEDCLVVSELSKICLLFHEIILEELVTETSVHVERTSSVIRELVMPFDYKYNQLNKSLITHQMRNH